MKTYHRSEDGLTVLLALFIVHLLFPVFLVYSWLLPSGGLALKFRQEQSRREKLEACIRKAEQRELAPPAPVLSDPYDGSCLGRNRINEACQYSSEQHKSDLPRDGNLDACDEP